MLELEDRIAKLNADLAAPADQIAELLRVFNLETDGQAVDIVFEHDWTPEVEHGEPNGKWASTKPKLIAKHRPEPMPPRKY